ncbi:FMN-dependent oxidoreductase, nitrilotriacetate monooxygenase family [Paenibacillus algorifonticola]|uniref:FMN-dependent oxidoreductase, nitrilotriacetate monooxygenase family n=1 Tax=Paenibacillus algorifonticola TaxID=684063 RepID=A0A1I2FGV8_9BACL|nr:NtaA/DmoA family FMN-dependent monooxygenase [Paenibacillus algorifonticola]SFF03988.1 FMN-dependent oxidoreductase, nitrilotriacetate monooxygenase family [Paenibacillus algorifonticola]
MEKRSKMQLALQMISGYGAEFSAWRMPGTDPAAYTNMDSYVERAKLAEQGKFQMIFIAVTPVLSSNLGPQTPMFPMDPMLALMAVARETKHIGLVATLSTTFNYPYNIARQFKALDVISHGRVGWNAVTTSDPLAAANFGARVTERKERYDKAHESIQIVQALWGSWESDAWTLDVEGGKFADMDKIQPINLQGQYYASRGPLPIPPSEQGQPVIFQAGGGREGLELAGKYASGVYANPYDIASAREHRQAIRQSAVRFGRNPDDIKMFAGFMFSLASTEEEALNRRKQLMNFNPQEIPNRVSYLGSMIGVPLSVNLVDIDKPIPADLLKNAYANPRDPRSPIALKLLLQGLSVRDVLAHGVINYHPVVAGTPTQVADFLEEWFLAEACDRFSVVPDVSFDGVADFVNQVIPILQERGLFHKEYEGKTLRENMSIPYEYGMREYGINE